jgi:ABC-type branched-subunit amino acid transport system substrate-binding protein
MKYTHRSRHRSRGATVASVAVVAASLLAACSSDDKGATTTTVAAATTVASTTEQTAADTTAPTETTVADTEATDATETTGATETTEETTATTDEPVADSVDQSLSGDAPGVSDDTIKIGVTYVDTEALKAVGLDYDLGSHVDTYQALVDDINAKGGINGRKLEAIFAPIDPTNAAAAEAACLKLTEDDDVFLITGFFLADSSLCPLETHNTAVVGGGMTPEWAARAVAPWVTWTPDADQAASAARLFADRDALGGTVAIYANVADKDQIDNDIMPVLNELGVKVVETGVNDAPTDDTAAIQSSAKLIAEKFKAAGADTILLVGIGAASWPVSMADDSSYRPKLLFTDTLAERAFYTSDATTDTSILDGALAAGQYGPDQARYDEATMQECVAILTAAGVDTPSPDKFDPTDSSNQPFQAAFQACPDIWLTKAVLERAGENLNYGTFRAAIDGLKITIPGDPTERTYGPPPAADGDPSVYLFAWDEATHGVKLDEG